MGMFDDIIVPKSYLKGLLTKKQENLIKSNNYQTKCLENALFQYKVYRQKLYLNNDAGWVDPSPKNSGYKPTSYTGSVNFYTSILDENGNSHWLEFTFTFNKGVLDSKRLDKFELQETAEEAKKREEYWRKRMEERDIFQKTIKYKFFNFLHAHLHNLTTWAARKMSHPNSPRAKLTKTKKGEKPSFWRDF